jgi:heptosyltransferase III
MKDQDGQETTVRYLFNKRVRALATWITGLITVRSEDECLNFDRERIDKILLVRATFRMGDSVLATPAIFIFRRNFPHTQIDFVGPVISKSLFQNLPIVQYYQIYQRPPRAAWAYIPLMKHIRATKYDLAIDVSCGKSALGAFIVGFSGARFRIGLKGRRDRWFNVRLDRPTETSKYKNLPFLVRSMGLPAQEVFPSLILSPDEKEKAKHQLRAAVMRRHPTDPVVGIFVGGRRSIGKRWPKENFMQVITNLNTQWINLVVFGGPEEKDVIGYFKETLPRDIPLVFEPSTRIFAALVSNCALFIACDSGPMHLACALGVRTVGIVVKEFNSDRWMPPASLARVVHQTQGHSIRELIEACYVELENLSSNKKGEELRMLSL